MLSGFFSVHNRLGRETTAHWFWDDLFHVYPRHDPDLIKCNYLYFKFIQKNKTLPDAITTDYKFIQRNKSFHLSSPDHTHTNNTLQNHPPLHTLVQFIMNIMSTPLHIKHCQDIFLGLLMNSFIRSWCWPGHSSPHSVVYPHLRSTHPPDSIGVSSP